MLRGYTPNLCDARVADVKTAGHDTLRSFKSLGAALLDAKRDDASLDQATEAACEWHRLQGLVATEADLTDTIAADPLAYVVQGYHRFRRYAPRMLRALDIEAAPLLQAAKVIEKRPERERPVCWVSPARDFAAQIASIMDSLPEASVIAGLRGIPASN